MLPDYEIAGSKEFELILHPKATNGIYQHLTINPPDMKHFLPFLIVAFLFSSSLSRASHVMGGEVSYRHMGGYKYEITFTMYRDCRGVGYNDTTMYAEMQGGSLTKRLKLIRVSITDRTPVCKKLSNPCNPANTTTSSSDPAIEEHVFKSTVDFEKADSAFKKTCNIRFGIGQCCRNTSFTGTAQDFWVWSSLDICSAKNNSSPILTVVPQNILCCNQPLYFNMGAIDTIDRDSLSYSWIDPMVSWSGKVTYNTGFSSKSPFSVYWPSGYDKSKGPKPDANPPIGLYLDPEEGGVIFTPTDCSETTAASILVKEWRKDSTGKYIHIGDVRRDMVFMIQTCPSNNAPILGGPYKLDVCAGQQLCFTITSDDKIFSPPPPTKTPPPDSVTIQWNGAIGRGATFTLSNKTDRLQSGKFCWDTKKADASDLPYYFTVTARDNHCSMNGVTTKAYAIRVKQKAETKRTYTGIKNGLIEMKSEIPKGFKGYPTYFWEILDSTGKWADTTLVDYYRTGTKKVITFKKSIDSIQFIKPGKYIIRHSINNAPLNCPTTYFDTIRTGAITPFLRVEPQYAVETWACKGTTHTLKPIVSHAISPIKYRWTTSPSDTLSSVMVTLTRDTVVMLDVLDGAGYKRSAKWIFHTYSEPLVAAGNNKVVCKNDSVLLEAKVLNAKDTIFYSWHFEGKQISDQPTIKVQKPGEYTIEIKDTNQCSLKKDTVTVSNLPVNVNAGADRSLCIGNTLTLKAKDTTSSTIKTYEWYAIRNLKTDSLLSKKDSVVVKPTKDQLYLVKQTTTLGSLKCWANDTLSVLIRALPQVELSRTRICQNETELDLNSIIIKPNPISNGILTWNLVRTLPKPRGGTNTLNDLVYDKDSGVGIHYYLNVDQIYIRIPNKVADSLELSLKYTDEWGCIGTSTGVTGIEIRTNIAVELISKVLKPCLGDTVKYLSNDFGVNYYGGTWYSENDSSSYLKWPQGDDVNLKEKVLTGSLNMVSGKYLAKYILLNNGCVSNGYGILNVLAYPAIEWTQTITGDSITLTDKTKGGSSRQWYLNGNVHSTNQAITLHKSIALGKTIVLSVSNAQCTFDSMVKPTADPVGILGLDAPQFLVYPNPAHYTLTIETNYPSIYQVRILNVLGQKMMEDYLTGPGTLDIRDLANGVYTLEILSGKESKRMRLMKQ